MGQGQAQFDFHTPRAVHGLKTSRLSRISTGTSTSRDRQRSNPNDFTWAGVTRLRVLPERIPASGTTRNGAAGKLEYRTVNPRARRLVNSGGLHHRPARHAPTATNGGGRHPRFNQGEPYVDINDNGQYDGPNSPALKRDELLPERRASSTTMTTMEFGRLPMEAVWEATETSRFGFRPRSGGRIQRFLRP